MYQTDYCIEQEIIKMIMMMDEEKLFIKVKVMKTVAFIIYFSFNHFFLVYCYLFLMLITLPLFLIHFELLAQ